CVQHSAAKDEGTRPVCEQLARAAAPHQPHPSAPPGCQSQGGVYRPTCCHGGLHSVPL
ncbi:hypothetical protein ISCGN_006124, partial [Ixodes scapularis]